MSYYARAPELRTRAVQRVSFLGPMYRTGRHVLAAPTWLGAQQAQTPVVPMRLWNRIPASLVEGKEPIPWWDVLVNRGL